MILTHENYHTIKNRYLSNSRMGDWLKSKDYFNKKHILGVLKTAPTGPMLIGSAVDCILTESWEKFTKSYHYKVLKKDDPVTFDLQKSGDDKRILLIQTDYNKAVKMAERVADTEAYHALADHETQVIMQQDMDIGQHFTGICGIPDWIKFMLVDGNVFVDIVDLKTAITADKKKYHWKCVDFGYYRQQAVIQMIVPDVVKERFPDFKGDIVMRSRHIVVEKDPDGIHNVYTFNLPQHLINTEKENVLDIIEDLKKEKNFNPLDATWEGAIDLE